MRLPYGQARSLGPLGIRRRRQVGLRDVRKGRVVEEARLAPLGEDIVRAVDGHHPQHLGPSRHASHTAAHDSQAAPARPPLTDEAHDDRPCAQHALAYTLSSLTKPNHHAPPLSPTYKAHQRTQRHNTVQRSLTYQLSESGEGEKRHGLPPRRRAI